MTHLNDMIVQAIQDSEEWFGEELSKDLTLFTIALGGEVGEFQNVVKKMMRDGLPFEEVYPLLKEELTDVLIYVLCLAGVLRVNLEEEYNRKRQFNEGRFGEGSTHSTN